ncbi:MarR family winged helix-turn-helix transcriptional regulator [Pseudorhodoplanes sp.]|jgi:DNA-binding MarR family transcriptional regulator|uniref:MarR family winged helix-turn-helix transcriptional regulator n=1 Tax=Pseudorhodoplanes sp. TaxID=1934341 RepID=UPI003D0A0F1F
MPFDELQKTLGFLLHDVARLMRTRFEQNARELGLTRSQWQVLAYLSFNEGIQQGALAELLEIESITLTRMLDKLEALGLVERRQHLRDRRAWQLYLTAKVGPLLQEMKRVGALTRQEALKGISQGDCDRLIRLLIEMKGNLLNALGRGSPDKRANLG